jgi:putative methyltransferase
MSLYYEAAAILANADNTGGSLVSRIYTKKDLKSSPGQIFALIAEASKWSIVLKDVIEKCGLLAEERKVRKGWKNLLFMPTSMLPCSQPRSLT